MKVRMNKLFVGILFGIILIQVNIVLWTGDFFKVSRKKLDLKYWIVCICIGLFEVVLDNILKYVPCNQWVSKKLQRLFKRLEATIQKEAKL
jgi:hypothetical protein